MKNSAKCLISLIITLFCQNIQNFATGAKASRIFGPYTIAVRSIDKCQLPGPMDKEKEASNNLAVTKVSRIKEELRGSIMIPQDIPDASGALSADFWRDGGYKPFLYKKFKTPCEEEYIAALIKNYIAMGQNCVIKKGNYSFAGIEPNKIGNKLIGENFFYEKVLITFAFYTRKGSVFCLKVSLETKPKVIRGSTKNN